MKPVLQTPRVLWTCPGTPGGFLATPRGLVLANAILAPDTGRRIVEAEGIGDFPSLLGERIVSYAPPGVVAHDFSTGRKVAEWPAHSPRFDSRGLVDLSGGVLGARSWSGERIWSRPCAGKLWAIARTRVYAGDAVLDRDTGRELWSHAGLDPVASDDAGVVCRPPGGWDQPLVAFDPDGAEIWRMEGSWDKGVVALAPNVVAGSLSGYDRDVPGLFLLDRRTGARTGTIEDDVRSAEVAGDVIYAHDGESVGAWTTSGKRLWRFEIRTSRIAATDGRLYIRGPDGSVTCLVESP